ncbi:putative helicase [Symbiodinium microadriaticum]|uniref:Putative helicase n=1 Tax=Symbiodinium microadriaticum TaxID=2951 RepID=A0A1Q9CIR7_SYMMI|nr:putative helicase [Symbiodinium microadriaticum]
MGKFRVSKKGDNPFALPKRKVPKKQLPGESEANRRKKEEVRQKEAKAAREKRKAEEAARPPGKKLGTFLARGKARLEKMVQEGKVTKTDQDVEELLQCKDEVVCALVDVQDEAELRKKFGPSQGTSGRYGKEFFEASCYRFRYMQAKDGTPVAQIYKWTRHRAAAQAKREELEAGAEEMSSPTSYSCSDAAFMERVRSLAKEALTWPFLDERQRLVWAAVLEFDAVPSQNLPPWFYALQNISRRHLGVDLFSLDGKRAVLCRAGNATHKAAQCTLWTIRGCKIASDSQKWLQKYGGQHQILTKKYLRKLQQGADAASDQLSSASEPPLWPCLEACAQGARVIEMACGTGKTRVIRELAVRPRGKAGVFGNSRGWQEFAVLGIACEHVTPCFGFYVCLFRIQVLVTVPTRVLLEQLAQEMPGLCKVGTGYNGKIDMTSDGFISVTDSVHLLQKLEFEAIYIDEAHHPFPKGLPRCHDIFKFSATHKEQVDFRYSLGEAIQQGALCDYDLTVPVTTEGHPYVCLASLLLSQAGRFRRVLAYCNSITEAKRFQQVLETLGFAAWHINGKTNRTQRERVMEEFSGELQKPVHVLVTVQLLGEGVNIPNAETCMFVEPKSSYVSIIQAIGRVLRPHPSKPMAHVVLPAIAGPAMPERAPFAESDPVKGAASATAKSTCVEDDVEDLEALLDEAGCDQQLPNKPRESSRRFQAGGSDGMQKRRQSYLPPIEILETGSNCQSAGRRDCSMESPLPATPAKLQIKQSVGKAEPCRSSHMEVGTGTLSGEPSDEFHRKQGSPGEPAPVTTVLSEHAPVLVSGSAENPSANGNIAESGISSSISTSSRPCQQDGGDLAKARCRHVKYPAEAHLLLSQRAYLGASTRKSTADGKMMTPKLKAKAFGDGKVGSATADQLDRFLEAIAQADSRFVKADFQHMQSRLWVTDCRLKQPVMQQLLVRDVQYQLALILQQRDPWELRLQAVERFDRAHGRLPREFGFLFGERTLGLWLQQTGFRVRRQLIPTPRMQKLLNTPRQRLQARVAKWLDPGTAFERLLKELRKFVELYQHMPRRSKLNSKAGYRLATNLQSFVRPDTKGREERLRLLEMECPIIAEWAKSRRSKKCQINHARWRMRLDMLIEHLTRTGSVSLSLEGTLAADKGLYHWLYRQRRRWDSLPLELRAELLDSHPEVASFLRS